MCTELPVRRNNVSNFRITDRIEQRCPETIELPRPLFVFLFVSQEGRACARKIIDKVDDLEFIEKRRDFLKKATVSAAAGVAGVTLAGTASAIGAHYATGGSTPEGNAWTIVGGAVLGSTGIVGRATKAFRAWLP